MNGNGFLHRKQATPTNALEDSAGICFNFMDTHAVIGAENSDLRQTRKGCLTCSGGTHLPALAAEGSRSPD